MTNGVRGVLPLLWLRWRGPGLGERKVRSIMDPEDDCLLRLLSGLGEPREWSLVKLDEEAEAERRMVRLVWIEATLVGEVGRARRAAAAAAALREELDVVESRRKAVRAAVVAEGETVEALRA